MSTEIDDQRKKLFILREETIENHNAFNKSNTNEKNGLTLIETSPEENIQDFKYNRLVWWDKPK